jgi:hypothetical protein
MLPVHVERVAGAEKEQITLVDAWPLDKAPRKPAAVDSYDVLDFSDLGDHEHDPFVMAVQGELGWVHGHDHWTASPDSHGEVNDGALPDSVLADARLAAVIRKVRSRPANPARGACGRAVHVAAGGRG